MTEEAKLRWKDRPLSEREAKVKRHFQKYSHLKDHVIVLLNPGAGAIEFKGLSEKFYSVKTSTIVGELVKLLELGIKVQGLEKKSFYMFVGSKLLNPNHSLADIEKEFPNKNDFVMIEYQDVYPF